MKEILGNNLEQFFFVLLDLLDYQKECGAICTYKSNRYEVWLMYDETFNRISDMSEEEFVKFAGEDAWWRSSNGSVLYSLDKGEITINHKKMIGWIRKPGDEEISTDILNNVSGNNIEYVKSQLEKLDDNIMEYMHYWFEKYYRNGFCDAVELISGCLR